MRPFLYMLAFLAVISLGFWAYRENYTTQASLREVRTLQREISGLHDAIAVQRAEWAYLNRPERLRDLVGLNFEKLILMPMEPNHFGSAAQVVYPAPEEIMPLENLSESGVENALSPDDPTLAEGL